MEQSHLIRAWYPVPPIISLALQAPSRPLYSAHPQEGNMHNSGCNALRWKCLIGKPEEIIRSSLLQWASVFIMVTEAEQWYRSLDFYFIVDCSGRSGHLSFVTSYQAQLWHYEQRLKSCSLPKMQSGSWWVGMSAQALLSPFWMWTLKQLSVGH